MENTVADKFDGATFDKKQDGERLTRQWRAIKKFMSDGEWRTLSTIETKLGYPQASISARLRDLRKAKFGSHRVESRRVGTMRGLYEYRLILNVSEPVDGSDL